MLALGAIDSASVPSALGAIDRRSAIFLPLFYVMFRWRRTFCACTARACIQIPRVFLIRACRLHLAALIIHAAIESPVNRLRKSVRGNAESHRGTSNLDDKHEGIF